MSANGIEQEYARWHCRRPSSFRTPPRDILCRHSSAKGPQLCKPAPPAEDDVCRAEGAASQTGGAVHGVLGWLLTPRAVRTIQLVRHRLSRCALRLHGGGACWR